VFYPELCGDHHRGAPRSQANEIVPARDDRQRDGKRDRGELHHPLEPWQAIQAPD
jgi:hypothetical protein